MNKHLSSEYFFIMYLSFLNKKIDEMIDKARSTAKANGVSWRPLPFLVGCDILAFDGKDILEFFGANLKPRENCEKACAELVALSKAFAQARPDILVMVIVGKPQLDESSGLLGRTLPPCGRCRGNMKYGYNLPPGTLIVLAPLEENGVREYLTLQDIWDKKGDKE